LAFTWFLSGAALLTALVALVKARRAAKRLERLTESYWELRYEHGQLRARFNQLSPEPTALSSPPASSPAASPASGPNVFIPMSSLKR
jgi:hypothetical protein